jgi:hypothetical protein
MHQHRIDNAPLCIYNRLFLIQNFPYVRNLMLHNFRSTQFLKTVIKKLKKI